VPEAWAKNSMWSEIFPRVLEREEQSSSKGMRQKKRDFLGPWDRGAILILILSMGGGEKKQEPRGGK